jgi:hypothetical protein
MLSQEVSLGKLNYAKNVVMFFCFIPYLLEAITNETMACSSLEEAMS